MFESLCLCVTVIPVVICLYVCMYVCRCYVCLYARRSVGMYVCMYVCLELCSSRIAKHWACQSMRHNHTIEPQSLHSTGLCLGFRVPKTRCGAPTFFFTSTSFKGHNHFISNGLRKSFALQDLAPRQALKENYASWHQTTCFCLGFRVGKNRGGGHLFFWHVFFGATIIG